MYTQCPDCREAFHVTAEILQQAGGRVRCGGCGHVFDALDGLSEAPPPYADAPDEDEERSFHKVLYELGDDDNVRIEDTGVEWRVVEEETGTDVAGADDAGDSSGASALRWYIRDDPEEPGNDAAIHEAEGRAVQEPLELETPTSEERYDDHTGLPDDDDVPAAPQTPRRRAEDFIEPRSPEFDERQVDLALGDPEEWTDLLEEVGDDDAQPLPAADAATPPDASPAPGAHAAGQAPEADEEPTAEHPVLDAGKLTLLEDEASGELTLVEDDAPAMPPSEDELTVERMIDQDLLQLTGQQAGLHAMPTGDRGPAMPQHVETIVMEGEFVRSSLQAEPAAPEPGGEMQAGDAGSLKDTYIRSRAIARADWKAQSAARYARVAAAALLVLLLAAQLVHANRETLATWDGFGATVGAVYRQLGVSITPEWDVNGWQFDATSGSTDASDTSLTISSRIANRSEHTLPYPLLHVTLTDRYEEVVGSGLLEPGQYLAIRSARGMVDPGEKFTATFTIAPLSTDATGFKVNVCYPVPDENVRCATGAFKRD